jgi:hypothetical protein
LYPLPSIIRMIKSRRMRWVGHVAWRGMHVLMNLARRCFCGCTLVTSQVVVRSTQSVSWLYSLYYPLCWVSLNRVFLCPPMKTTIRPCLNHPPSPSSPAHSSLHSLPSNGTCLSQCQCYYMKQT